MNMFVSIFNFVPDVVSLKHPFCVVLHIVLATCPNVPLKQCFLQAHNTSFCYPFKYTDLDFTTKPTDPRSLSEANNEHLELRNSTSTSGRV